MPRRSEFRIGRRAVEALRVEKGDAVFWDRDLAGFGVRVHATGRKVYVVQTRGPDGPRRVSLGRHGEMSADEARRRARSAIDRLKRGEDPFPPRELTVGALAERYLGTHVAVHCKPGSARLYRLVLRRHILPALGAKPLGAVGRKDAADLHRRLREYPYIANRTARVLSGMYRQAEAWGLVPPGSDPCRSLRYYPERPRDRFLAPDEYRRLGAALGEAEARGPTWGPAVAAIRMLLLTGCRKGEIVTLRWDDIDLTAGELRLQRTKSGPRMVPLTAPVLRVLDGIPRARGNPWVIRGRRPGTHLTDLAYHWTRIAARAGLEDVRIHDLRHSYASRALALGEGLSAIGRLLGHAEVGTTARYAHPMGDTEKAAAARVGDSIAVHIASARAAPGAGAG